MHRYIHTLIYVYTYPHTLSFLKLPRQFKEQPDLQPTHSGLLPLPQIQLPCHMMGGPSFLASVI